MFIMTCLLESRPLNLPVLILHTMSTTCRHSMACLSFGRLIIRLLRALRALRADPGTEAAITIPRDYGFYTMDTLSQMGFTIYQDSYEHARKDHPASS
ncbi:hypothetical protein P3X46_012225 [Hevea brasiliensis]|uniref:Uncharacterized protein n=1 Tax=Hevea brasiliensis TaxID=3981 RepID=A0ABQ9MBX8_HEVBR|nr:hypothetical protein P3X46_012225 [Hevea brasiliensis]